MAVRAAPIILRGGEVPRTFDPWVAVLAPVFSDDGEVTYYVPKGTWTHFQTNEKVEGPRWVRERHGFSSIPLLVRSGAAIAIGDTEDRPDYRHEDNVMLRAYELAEEVPVTVSVGAAVFMVVRGGGTLRVIARAGVRHGSYSAELF